MAKKKLMIDKALFEDDKLVVGIQNHEDKVFNVSDLKKFSIRKTKSSNRIYYILLPFLVLGYFIHHYFYAILVIGLLYFFFVKFYYRVYKLILIDKSGTKYVFTFNKKMRSIIFNIRLQVKYKLLID